MFSSLRVVSVIFDLHHLFFMVGVRSGDLTESVDPAIAEAAIGKVGGFTFQDFKEQVLPYLSEELIGLYRDSAVFEKQKEEVERALIEMMK